MINFLTEIIINMYILKMSKMSHISDTFENIAIFSNPALNTVYALSKLNLVNLCINNNENLYSPKIR